MTDPHPRFTSDDFAADDPLAALVRSAAPRGFGPDFRSTVLTSLAARHESALVSALERQFVRIVPLAAAATLLLAGYNWWGGRTSSASTLDAALNLPRVTVAAAYSPTQLFGATIASTESP
jgi:hypothetical protein